MSVTMVSKNTRCNDRYSFINSARKRLHIGFGAYQRMNYSIKVTVGVQVNRPFSAQSKQDPIRTSGASRPRRFKARSAKPFVGFLSALAILIPDKNTISEAPVGLHDSFFSQTHQHIYLIRSAFCIAQRRAAQPKIPMCVFLVCL